jgi:hypothetical protein
MKQKKHIVMCRVCREKFDTVGKELGVDYVMPSRNYFYHKECYDSWKKKSGGKSNNSDKQWEEYIYDYLKRDLKMEYEYFKVKKQLEKFRKKGMTYKGIFLTLKFFYDVEKGDMSKAHGGIGIVEYVYERACAYWVQKERETKGVCESIRAQMQEAKESQEKRISYRAKTKKKKKKNLLDEIEMEED